MCEHMRGSVGRYVSNPAPVIHTYIVMYVVLTLIKRQNINICCVVFVNLQEFVEKCAERMTERTLYNIVEDLCLFLIKHVICKEGKYHDHESLLSSPEYEALTEVYRLKLTREGY